jgi:hypothetical protein
MVFCLGNVNEFTFAGLVEMYSGTSWPIYIGDETMEIAEQRSFKTVKGEVRHRDAAIFLGYSIFAMVLLAVCFATTSSGMAPGDLVSMTVFP